MTIDETNANAPTYQHIRYQVSVPLALIVIERPDHANALDSTTIQELTTIFAQIAIEPQIRAVILTGAGQQYFSSGFEHTLLEKLDPQAAKTLAQQGQALTTLISRLGKPVIAALNGLAIGAGFELALACHLRVAADSAELGFLELKQNTIPCLGGLRRLSQLVGRSRVLSLLLAGTRLDAYEAAQWGLLHKVVPVVELFSETRDLAQRLADNAPLAVKYALELIDNCLEMPSADSLFLEATLFGLCAAATKEISTDISALQGQRFPLFKG